MKRLAAIVIISVLAVIPGFSIPAKQGLRTLVQPDGTSFQATVTGDEHAHLTRLLNGCAIVRDSRTGYYCYAGFDAECKMLSSGVAVGSQNVPDAVISASRTVPDGFFSRRITPMLTEDELFCHLTAEEPSVKKTVRVIIVLCQFSDLPFTYTREDIDNMVNKPSYSDYGATGSVMDYFKDQLGEWYDFAFDVSGIVTLSKGYKYYGEDDPEGMDKHPEEAVEEACRLSDQNIDFSKYDKIFVIYAGGSPSDYSADDDHIWPHAQSGLNMVFDGKRFTAYSMSSELMASSVSGKNTLAGIGTICHEFSHILGLSDYYDTDYEKSGGTANAMYQTTALMDGGGYNNDSHTPPGYNAVDYWTLGIGGRQLKAGTNVLKPMRSAVDYIIIESPDTADELFLLECRDNTSWDKYVGGKGMLVYHIDRSTRSAGYSTYYEKTLTARQRWAYNEINCRPDNECAKIITASAVSRPDSYDSDISGIFFGSKVTSLDPENLVWWNGTQSQYSLTSVVRGSDGSVTIVASDSGASIPITLEESESFQDAAIVHWSAGNSRRTMTLACNGREYEVAPYEDGQYSCVVEGLTPNTGYKAVITCLDSTAEYEFTTKPYYNTIPAYIYMGGVEKTISGLVKSGAKISLRLFNAPGARVEWYWGSKKISPGSDGYHTILRSGELRAVVTYEDGSVETIYKYISVK